MGCLTVRLHRGNHPTLTTREKGLGSDGPTRSTSGGRELRKAVGVGDRPGKPLGSGHGSGGVAGEGRRAGPLSAIFPPEPEVVAGSPSERPGRRASSLPEVGFGQRGARRLRRGAQSPALTQLKAGVAAPPWRRRRRPHSPAEVIMAAPRTRPPARSPPGPRRVSVSSGPARFAEPPGSPRCPARVSRRLRPPAHFSPRTLPAQELPTMPPAARREFCPLGPCLPGPPLPPRLARDGGARRAPWSSLTLLEATAPAGTGTRVRTRGQASE